MKFGLKFAGGILLLLCLSWLGTYLYWQVRIGRALRRYETAAEAHPTWWAGELMTQDDHYMFQRAGCRSIPALVAALSPEKSARYLEMLTFQLRLIVVYSPADSLILQCRIKPEDPAEVRVAKIERIRSWWDSSGREYHHWWNVWSDWCSGIRR